MKKHKYTLIEVMIVVAVIAILTAIGVPALATNRTTTMDQTRNANVKKVETAITNYLNANQDKKAEDIDNLATVADYLDDDYDTAEELKIGNQVIFIIDGKAIYIESNS